MRRVFTLLQRIVLMSKKKEIKYAYPTKRWGEGYSGGSVSPRAPNDKL